MNSPRVAPQLHGYGFASQKTSTDLGRLPSSQARGAPDTPPSPRPNPRTSPRPACTLPDVLFPTVNVRRKRLRSAVTNVRRSGSRPYFEWESELRWRTQLPVVPFHCRGRSLLSCVLLDASIDCGGEGRIAIDCATVTVLLRRYSDRPMLTFRQYCGVVDFTTRSHDSGHLVDVM